MQPDKFMRHLTQHHLILFFSTAEPHSSPLGATVSGSKVMLKCKNVNNICHTQKENIGWIKSMHENVKIKKVAQRVTPILDLMGESEVTK